jgi:SAM-dependent methyltransferase
MLDVNTYRMSESLAKNCIPNWRIAQTHNVDLFQSVGFPVRIGTLQETAQLIDTMQENRFDIYMRELGGLTEGETRDFVSACRRVVEFQLTAFPLRRPVLPLSTMLSSYALYRKIRGYRGDVGSVLEVGPGCGYLSFFLERDQSLKNYSQIEACESFYILQSMIDQFCFGPAFVENAIPPNDRIACDYFLGKRGEDIEIPVQFAERPVPAICAHYPWWRIGELVRQNAQFDIVTSNANLLEFRADALGDYLELFRQVLKPDGILLVQCTGFTAHGSLDDLLHKVYGKGFATVMFFEAQQPIKFSKLSSNGLLGRLDRRWQEPRTFATNNGVFVKEGHPIWQRYYSASVASKHFVGSEGFLGEMFFRAEAGAKVLTKDDIAEEVRKSFGRSA